ncbi:MAG: RNA polymerase sporulation sigma factor SigG [Clostridia bacterium]|nr:RNA polymerase sporulation sigma factor SigG [Clostridia bacterium]MBR2473178.1 RNA polymerase sporulation sigma factor SigG [Clostridia bacterium]
MQVKVEICGVNTAKLVVLKNEETLELIEKAQAGDKEALDRVVTGNLKLVLSVVQRFAGRGESPDDLFQVGVIGLIKAVNNFDPSLKVRFSTYGVPMVIGEIRRYLRDSGALRVSRSMRDNAYRALTVKEALTNELQREPTVEEIAKRMGVERQEVVFALDAIADPISLYEPVFQESGDSVCVMDQVRDLRNTDDSWIEQISIRQALGELTPREKKIMSLRFYEGKTQIEVAREVGISQAQVSRLEKGVLDKIKSYM